MGGYDLVFARKTKRYSAHKEKGEGWIRAMKKQGGRQRGKR